MGCRPEEDQGYCKLTVCIKMQRCSALINSFDQTATYLFLNFSYISFAILPKVSIKKVYWI